MESVTDYPMPRELLADAGYDSDDNRDGLLLHGVLPVIKPMPNRKNIPVFDRKSYKNRNCIERMFNKFKQFRRIATRYDKTASSFTGFLNLAAINSWTKSFVHKT